MFLKVQQYLHHISPITSLLPGQFLQNNKFMNILKYSGPSYWWECRELIITKRMAACTFYKNALQASRANDWIEMTRIHLMMRNFSTTNKLTSCLMPVLQKTSTRFLNNLRPQCFLVKCTSSVFRYGQFFNFPISGLRTTITKRHLSHKNICLNF